MSLKNVYDILQKIAAEPKTTEKIKIIRENSTAENFKNVIFYALDYNKVYNMSYLNYYPEEKTKSTPNEIFRFLDHLSGRNGATLEEKKQLAQLASVDLETNKVVSQIVKKDLRCGASIKTFLKVFPDLPYFEMMTCSSDLNKFLKLLKDTNSTPFWSLKKDGVRTWAINKGDSIQYLSRSGLSYFNFHNFDKEVSKLTTLINKSSNIPIDTPIDGESTVINGNFQDVMRNIRTLESGEAQFQFNVFDLAYPQKTFEERYRILESVFKLTDFKHLKLLNHYEIKDPTAEKINKIMNSAVKSGEEGIVLKSSKSPYEFKEKSKHWCKMKPVETFDLVVIGTYLGKKGKKFDGTLGGLIVKFKDKEVHVGSGFTEEERKQFLKNPPKLIEVDCKGITEDGSLREPRFIRVRDDKLTSTDES